jgi:very-short-patch-repair endonuclease
MKTTAEFIEQAHKKHGSRFDYSKSQYGGFTMPIEVVCSDHGSCWTTPKSHLHSHSGGCLRCRKNICSKALSLTKSEFIQRAQKIHGDYYDYRLVDYMNGQTHVIIICPQHGPFRMKPNRHLIGRGCRRCISKKLGEERKLSFWDFVVRVATVHGAYRYEYDLQDCLNAHSKITIRCPQHGQFLQSVATHLKGHGCPRCVQSNGERRVREVLNQLGVDFSEQVRFVGCRDRGALPFDFYIPGHRLLIEFDGRQHYDNSELWGGKKKLAETQRHDAIKNNYAAENNYSLLRIPYWNVNNIEDILLNQLAMTTKT